MKEIIRPTSGFRWHSLRSGQPQRHSSVLKALTSPLSLNVAMFALDQVSLLACARSTSTPSLTTPPKFIVVTAVPEIISEFEATDKLAFINSGFFIPCVSPILASLIFQLTPFASHSSQVGFVCFFTQLMTIFTPKNVFLAATLIFMIGMAICVSPLSRSS